MSQIGYAEMAADAWNSVTEPEVVAILVCSKCQMYSIYSWEIKNEEEWKQKYFCPHCQSRFFSRVSRGDKRTKSKWALMETSPGSKEDPEKWKVAERLMGKASLLKKEDLINKMLTKHVQSLNADLTKKKTTSLDIQVSDIERHENDQILKHFLNQSTSSNKYARSR